MVTKYHMAPRLKLWVDLDRPAPDDTWIVFRTARGAIACLDANPVDWLSLGYELDGLGTGYNIARWIQYRVHAQPDYEPPVILIHATNPRRRAEIQEVANAIHKTLLDRAGIVPYNP